MFNPAGDALDLAQQLEWGRLCRTPLDLGTWALLEPAGLQNHAPQLCWLDAERLCCVWMAGGQEGTAGMGIYWSVLQARTGCWSTPEPISQDLHCSEQNPLLFRHPDGSVQLVHTAQQARDPADYAADSASSFSMQWTACLRSQRWLPSEECWSVAEELLPAPAFCRHPPLRRADGCWLLPIYRSLETGGAFGHDHSEVLILEPDGCRVRDRVDVPGSTGRVHGSLVLSADGSSLLQFFRSRLADCVYRSVGDLDGLGWSEPEPVALPNNNSSIQALRLSSGRLAMVLNRFALESLDRSPSWGEARWPRTRWPLSLALSEDDGLSWPWIRDLDTGWGFCGTANWFLNGQLAYPTVLEGLAGELHVAYSWAGREAIRYVCLSERDVVGLT